MFLKQITLLRVRGLFEKLMINQSKSTKMFVLLCVSGRYGTKPMRPKIKNLRGSSQNVNSGGDDRDDDEDTILMLIGMSDSFDLNG